MQKLCPNIAHNYGGVAKYWQEIIMD